MTKLEQTTPQAPAGHRQRGQGGDAVATTFSEYLYEETRIRVCEEVGPNSPEYDYLMDKHLGDEEWGLRVYDRWLDYIARVSRRLVPLSMKVSTGITATPL